MNSNASSSDIGYTVVLYATASPGDWKPPVAHRIWIFKSVAVYQVTDTDTRDRRERKNKIRRDQATVFVP